MSLVVGRRRVLFILAVFLMCCLIDCAESGAKNLLPNSSFELTTVPDVPDGYNQYLGPVATMDWFDLWNLDRNMAYMGKNSLRLTILKNNQIGKVFVQPIRNLWVLNHRKWDKILAGKYYTFSLYMRSDREAFPVEIILDDKRIARISRTWKRYSFTTRAEIKKDESLSMIIMPRAIGQLWIDCLQIEEGKIATPYEASIIDLTLQQNIPSETRESIKKRVKNRAIVSNNFRITPQFSYYSCEPELKVLVDRISPSFSFSDATLKLSIMDDYGRKISDKTEKLNLGPGASKAIIKLNMKDIPNGKYKLKAYMINNGKKYVSSETEFIKQAPSKNEAKIDHFRRCIWVDGRPFLVIAANIMRVYSCSDHLPQLLKMIKDKGYTTVIPTFSDGESNVRSSDKEMLRFCDLAYQNGLKVIPWIEPNAIKTPNGSFKPVGAAEPKVAAEKYLDEFLNIIPKLKNHPALLAWYLCDEPDERLCAAGFTSKLVSSARLLDPTHPLYINYYDDATDYKLYNGKVPGDIVSKTVYPIPFRPITLLAYRMEEALQSGEAIKPVFPWLQLWSQFRYPSPAEFRCMAYLALVSGATGIQTWPTMPSSKILWDYVKSINKEITDLEQLIFYGTPSPIPTIDSDFIYYMSKVFNNKLYIIAVNAARKNLNVTINTSNVAISSPVKVIFENREITIDNGLIKDQFHPLQRHVYVIDLK